MLFLHHHFYLTFDRSADASEADRGAFLNHNIVVHRFFNLSFPSFSPDYVLSRLSISQSTFSLNAVDFTLPARRLVNSLSSSAFILVEPFSCC